jgi:hypothetical protein
VESTCGDAGGAVPLVGTFDVRLLSISDSSISSGAVQADPFFFLDIRVTCQPFSRCAAPLARRDLPRRLRTTRHQWSAAADPAVPGPGMRSWLPTAPSKTCADQADRVFSGFLNVPGFLISSWPPRTSPRACGSTHERHLSSRHRVLEFQSAPRTQKRHSGSRDALLPVSRLARP